MQQYYTHIIYILSASHLLSCLVNTKKSVRTYNTRVHERLGCPRTGRVQYSVVIFFLYEIILPFLEFSDNMRKYLCIITTWYLRGI